MYSNGVKGFLILQFYFQRSGYQLGSLYKNTLVRSGTRKLIFETTELHGKARKKCPEPRPFGIETADLYPELVEGTRTDFIIRE